MVGRCPSDATRVSWPDLTRSSSSFRALVSCQGAPKSGTDIRGHRRLEFVKDRVMERTTGIDAFDTMCGL